jgi:hypothetical protein
MDRSLKILIILLWVGCSSSAMLAADTMPVRAPILVELFTSEGCSSCPPADALLKQWDATQPVPGVQLIVLSEHVDYWDRQGWKDPYSSRQLTDRQTSYANHFALASPYTPQMVVDGSTEFVGSDARLAAQAIEKAVRSQKTSIHLSSISLDASGKLSAYVEADAVPKGPGADIYFVVALNHADSEVERGENKGRHLAHVAVVQSMTKIGATGHSNFAKRVEIKIDPRANLSNLRLIAFLQHGSGSIVGATMSVATSSD